MALSLALLMPTSIRARLRRLIAFAFPRPVPLVRANRHQRRVAFRNIRRKSRRR